MSEADRIAAISARANVLFTRISKAVGPKRPRVPGDGDGDGIPNEGKKPKGAATNSVTGSRFTPEQLAGYKPSALLNEQLKHFNTPEMKREMQGLNATEIGRAMVALMVADQARYVESKGRLQKAAAGPKRPRVPGDGDGDGIPNESRRKKPAALGANDKFAEQHVTSGQSVSVLRLSNVNMSEGTAQFKGEGRVWEARRVHVKGTPKPQWKLTGEYSEVHKAGPKRPRIPGDGDGDGIAYEGRNKPGTAGAPKKAPSLIDVLNHPEGRRLVEAIEDTMSSLEGKKNDKILGNVLRAQAQELKDRFGFDHYGAKELVQQHLGSPSPAPVAPAPGTKWSSHAVMVHPQTGQRTVVPRSSAKNFPESEGWKEVGPGVKTPKPTKR